MSLTVWTVVLCHPERSEGSLAAGSEILRYAQDDTAGPFWCLRHCQVHLNHALKNEPGYVVGHLLGRFIGGGRDEWLCWEIPNPWSPWAWGSFLSELGKPISQQSHVSRTPPMYRASVGVLMSSLDSSCALSRPGVVLGRRRSQYNEFASSIGYKWCI